MEGGCVECGGGKKVEPSIILLPGSITRDAQQQEGRAESGAQAAGGDQATVWAVFQGAKGVFRRLETVPEIAATI